VLKGSLEHRDSMGTGSVIRPGDVQRMSAGTGVTHSEFNASKHELVHFLQIWIVPRRRGLEPSYEQNTLTEQDKRGRLRVVASPDGRDGSVTLHAEAIVHDGLFDRGEAAELRLEPGRHAWVQVVRGKVRVNGRDLEGGDGVALSDEAAVRLEGIDRGAVLAFDLA
jgi:redox-sensitive bicupin YhaK (pirin superfamily)